MIGVTATRGTFSALLSLALLAGAAEAQRENHFPTRRVLRAVLAELRATEDLGNHPVVEARALCEPAERGCTGLGRILAPRAVEGADSLIIEIGGRVGRAEDVHQCGATPDLCRLVSASALIVLGTPVVQGDSATVAVAMWLPSPSLRQPVEMKVFAAVVRRGSGGRLIATLRVTLQT
jgi:hypothetical protein